MSFRRTHHRWPARTGFAAAAGSGLLLLVACSGSATGHGSVATPASKATAPTAIVSSPPPTSAPATTPSGLTPSGTTLRLGAEARVPFETETLSKQSSVLAISIRSVQPGRIADLRGFNLDAQTKAGAPFYVKASFRNVGSRAVKPSGIFGVIDAFNTAGDKLGELDLIGDFARCDGTPPDSLAPGQSFTECQVYVAPAGQRVAKVVFDHFVQNTETTVSWPANG